MIFLHRPPRKKEQRPWYENALLLAVAGSIIAVVGQLAGTVIPIMYGPEDISDFNIDLNPINRMIDVQKSMSKDGVFVPVNITIEDLHRRLRPYRFKIQFQASGPINDTDYLVDPPYIKLPSQFESPKLVRSTYTHPYRNGSIQLTFAPQDMTTIYIHTRSKSIGDYPIIIKGIGSDGKTHNSTFTLRIVSHEDYLKSLNESIPVKGEKIHS